VATYYSVTEAELACASLAGARIDARVEGQHAVGVLPLHAIALGGVRVVVGAADVTRARELLEAQAGQAEGGDAASSLEQGLPLTEDAGDPWMRRAVFAGFLGLSLCPCVGSVYSLMLIARYGRLPMSTRGRITRNATSQPCAA
jgi:hypothetical protein